MESTRDDDLEDDDLEDEDLDDDQLDEEHGERTREEGGSFTGRVISDFARRAIMTGIGAVFMSEETLRNTLSEMKLPKEAMGYIVGQADRTKRELIAALSREMRSFLNSLELEKLLAKVLAGTTFEIQTRVKILPAEDGRMMIQILDTKTDVSRGRSPSDASSADPEPAEPKRRRSRARRERRPSAGRGEGSSE